MYKLTKDKQVVIRKEDGTFIPMTLGNIDYDSYLEWLSKGNSPEPAQTVEESTKEQEETAKMVQYIQDIETAKQYSKLKALTNMTPTQVQEWVANNVKTLPQAQDAITTLAIAVSVLARRL